MCGLTNWREQSCEQRSRSADAQGPESPDPAASTRRVQQTKTLLSHWCYRCCRRARCGGSGGSVRCFLEAERAEPERWARRSPSIFSKLRPGEILGPIPSLAGTAGIRSLSRSRAVGRLEQENDKLAGSGLGKRGSATRVREKSTGAPSALRSASTSGLCTHLGCSPKYHGEVQPRAVRCELAGRLLLPLSRLGIRSGRPGGQGCSGSGQSAGSAS